MKKILTAALLAGGLILATATAASAHTSHVTHAEVCTDERATKTVVTVDNDPPWDPRRLLSFERG